MPIYSRAKPQTIWKKTDTYADQDERCKKIMYNYHVPENTMQRVL